MRKFIKFSCVILLFGSAMFFSCSSDNVRSPEYHSEILLDGDLGIVDMGRAGESTEDDNYYYHGSVTLYDEYGGSRDFPCYIGKNGLEQGCRGVIYAGEFYNLDRSKWVTIGGVKYKASNLVN